MARPAPAALAAYASVLAFVTALVLVSLFPQPEAFDGAPTAPVAAVNILFLAFHLVLYPVVAALPAPEWARAAGYGWLTVDNGLVMLTMFGGPMDLVVPLRWGVHFATAMWVLGVAMRATGAFRVVAGVTSVAFVGVTLAGPHLGGLERVQSALAPAAIGLVVLLVMAGGRLWRGAAEGEVGRVGAGMVGKGGAA